jgi:hypothetical protein
VCWRRELLRKHQSSGHPGAVTPTYAVPYQEIGAKRSTVFPGPPDDVNELDRDELTQLPASGQSDAPLKPHSTIRPNSRAAGHADRQHNYPFDFFNELKMTNQARPPATTSWSWAVLRTTEGEAEENWSTG